MAKIRKRNPVPEAQDEDAIAVLKYLKKQNRPYNQNDIFNNLGGKIGKTNISRTLTQLAKDGLVIEKAYGKQLIYSAVQDQETALDKNEIEEYKKKISDTRAEVLDLQKKLKTLQAEFTSITNAPSMEMLVQRHNDVKRSNLELESKLKSLANSKTLMTTEKEQSDADALLDTMRSQWRKRKAIFKDILDTISESMEGNIKDLMTRLGIENDDEAGVNINTFSNFLT